MHIPSFNQSNQYKKSYKFIDNKDILYCEADSNYTLFHLQNGRKVIKSVTLKSVTKDLGQCDFLRIHSKYLVSKSKIKSINAMAHMLSISNGVNLPIAKRRMKYFLNALDFYSMEVEK